MDWELITTNSMSSGAMEFLEELGLVKHFQLLSRIVMEFRQHSLIRDRLVHPLQLCQAVLLIQDALIITNRQ